MAYTAPTLEQFRLRFPEFAGVSDAVVSAAITDASRFVPPAPPWLEIDYPVAILFLAAHFVFLGELARLTTASALSGGGSGIQSISYGQMSVSFKSAKTIADLIGRGGFDVSSPYYARFAALIPDPMLPQVI